MKWGIRRMSKEKLKPFSPFLIGLNISFMKRDLDSL
jgi:hypothetical protein